MGLSDYLCPGAKLCLVVYAGDTPELDIGAQDTNLPRLDHWRQRFRGIGHEGRALTEELVAALKLTRGNLRACQATIHLCSGVDPANVTDAQAAMKVADAVLAKIAE